MYAPCTLLLDLCRVIGLRTFVEFGSVLALRSIKFLLSTPCQIALSCEEQIKILQMPIGSLNVEEEDWYQHPEVDQSKDDEDPEVHGFDQVRCDLVDNTSSQRECNSRESDALGTTRKREDLCRVDPADSQPCCSVGERVDVENGSHPSTVLQCLMGMALRIRLNVMGQNAAHEQLDAHKRAANKHQLSTSDTVDEIDRQGEAGSVADQVAPSEEIGLLQARQREHLRRIGGNEVDADEFLHDLDPASK